VSGYRTIVADPPWEQDGSASFDGRGNDTRVRRESGRRTNSKTLPLPYPTMKLPEIAALPVSAAAADDAHLYLWVTNRYIEDAYSVARGWGFRPITLLTWCKPPMGLGLGGTFVQTTEHILFCRRGRDVRVVRADSTWWQWKRGPHSAKPEAFIDLVEQVSPGPYLEMFARRARFGWDYWGDQSLGTAEMPEAAA
jgi:N6-adenosine-specific RNA methylase IME4